MLTRGQTFRDETVTADEPENAELQSLRAEVAELRRELERGRVQPQGARLKVHLDALMRLNTEPRFRGHPALGAIGATLELAAEVLDTDLVGAWLLTDERRRLLCVDQYDLRAGTHSANFDLKAEDYPRYFEAVLAERAVAASDALADPRTSEFTDAYLKPMGVRSLLDAAIRRRGETLGVVCFEQKGKARAWTLEEVSFAGQVADHVARILADDERRQTHLAMEQSERNYREIFNASSDALLIVDGDGRLLDVNERMCSMFGYDRESVKEVSIGALSLGEPPFTQEQAQAIARRAMSEGPQTFEWRCRRADGELFWSEVSLRASDIAGARRVIAAIRDITARKQDEEQRAALQAQLQQARKMEALGRLAGGVAHDFNNLLTAIRGNVELAQMELPPDGSAYRALTHATQAADSAAGLTRQLLAFSRRHVIAYRTVDLGELLHAVETMLARLIGEDVALNITVQEGVWGVTADPSQLEQVMLNLVINARDAMPNGGRLTVSASNVVVPPELAARDASNAPGEHVRIRVSDTGQGMSHDVKDRIFEPFFTTKPLGNGTGLGLSTIFGIVQQIGGFIHVASEVGAGSTFDIYLPRTRGPSQDPDPEAPATFPEGHETVLLVEDDKLVRDITVTSLQRLGYDVHSASCAEEAIEFVLATEVTIDLLLTDVVLPGKNGPQLAEILGALRPGLKTLFVSGYTADIPLQKGDEKLDFLAKPYSLDQLACKIREVLAGPSPIGKREA